MRTRQCHKTIKISWVSFKTGQSRSNDDPAHWVPNQNNLWLEVYLCNLYLNLICQSVTHTINIALSSCLVAAAGNNIELAWWIIPFELNLEFFHIEPASPQPMNKHNEVFFWFGLDHGRTRVKPRISFFEKDGLISIEKVNVVKAKLITLLFILLWLRSNLKSHLIS